MGASTLTTLRRLAAVPGELGTDPGPGGLASVGKKIAWAAGLIAYVACTYLVANSSEYHQGLVAVAAAYAVLALGLDLAAGALGLYSFGHAGLFAIGAYGTAILVGHDGWSVFSALPVVVAAAGVAGLVIGALSLRVSGLYFAITTLIFAIVVTVLVSHLAITGGYQGLASPTFPSFPGSMATALGSSLTWAVGGCLFVTVLVVWSIRRSAMYPALLAVRDAERFASSAGMRTAITKIVVFGLSASIAGLAGWIFCFLGFITPSQFGAVASINVFVMIIVGGMNTLVGPIAGATFVGLFPVAVTINSLWQEVIYGSIFVGVIIFFPEGFVGLVVRGARLVMRGLPGRVRVPRSAEVFDPVRNPEIQEPAVDPPAKVLHPGAVEASGWDAGRCALEVAGIAFSYGHGVRVLEDVDLRVERGSIHGLIGPNGSGKSTLVDILSGFLVAEQGTITINGRRAESMRSWERVNLGLVRTFQTAAMVDELTTRDNVSIGLYRSYRHLASRALLWPLIPSARRDSKEIAHTSASALAAVGVRSPWPSRRIADVPHGVEQLTQLAAVCVGRPSIVVLDEPLAGLSTEEVEHVEQILRDLSANGVTVLVIEHQTHFIFSVCDHVTVLAAGHLVASGTADEVRADSRVREVYLGR